MITSSNTMALNNHCATALGPRLGLGLRLDFGSQVWFVQYFSENLVVVLYASCRRGWRQERKVVFWSSTLREVRTMLKIII